MDGVVHVVQAASGPQAGARCSQAWSPPTPAWRSTDRRRNAAQTGAALGLEVEWQTREIRRWDPAQHGPARSAAQPGAAWEASVGRLPSSAAVKVDEMKADSMERARWKVERLQ
jgi:hypothetical protein